MIAKPKAAVIPGITPIIKPRIMPKKIAIGIFHDNKRFNPSNKSLKFTIMARGSLKVYEKIEKL